MRLPTGLAEAGQRGAGAGAGARDARKPRGRGSALWPVNLSSTPPMRCTRMGRRCSPPMPPRNRPDTRTTRCGAHVRDADAVSSAPSCPTTPSMGTRPSRAWCAWGGAGLHPVAAATARGIPVATCRAATRRPWRNMVLRFVPPAPAAGPHDGALRANGWNPARGLADGTSELGATTLGIVGLGAIGSRIAAIASAGFGMRFLGASRSGRCGGCRGGGPAAPVRGRATPSPSPARSRRRRKVSSAPTSSAACRPTRCSSIPRAGPSWTRRALVAAVRDGRIAGAATDVYDAHPVQPDDALFGLEGLLMTPHVAGITATSMRAMSLGAAERCCACCAASGRKPRQSRMPDCLKVHHAHFRHPRVPSPSVCRRARMSPSASAAAVKRDAVLVRVETDEGIVGWARPITAAAPAPSPSSSTRPFPNWWWGSIRWMPSASGEGLSHAACEPWHGRAARHGPERARHRPVGHSRQGPMARPSTACSAARPAGSRPMRAASRSAGRTLRVSAEEALSYVAQGYRALKCGVGDTPSRDVRGCRRCARRWGWRSTSSWTAIPLHAG